ncbi:MAG TPA: hypothetical protein VI451_13120 [Anaerolineales bacterium]|nr:hypothetical protein [Anaerolineales bacterium]
MRRQHPFHSPTGIVLTLFLTITLALLLWFTGGQMFSPGPLTAKAQAGKSLGGVASHAEIKSCNTCHQPLETEQAALCLECHTGVQEQLTKATGLHARMNVETPCFACHPDHRGRDFDPTLARLEDFDHSITRFSLIWHQVDYDAAPLECADCHMGEDFSVNPQACTDCHIGRDAPFMAEHQQDFGTDCLACHDGADRMVDFDHHQTDFPLEGKHSSTKCAACHVENQFEGASARCVSCHAEPAIHAGLFDPQCDACHTPGGWTPATLGSAAFDHTQRFSLIHHKTDFSGAILNCAACHQASLETVDLNVCTTCHTQAAPVFMAEHQQQYGTNCLDCHDGVDRMHDFDHASFFVLEGRHAEIECAACHVDQKFAGTPSECAQCHAEPAIHAGLFGVQCGNCHSTAAWTPASLKSHTIPLDHGGEGMIACETCHPTSYVQYTCDACHEPVEMKNKHNKEGIFDITNCVECHPTGLKEEGESGEGD